MMALLMREIKHLLFSPVAIVSALCFFFGVSLPFFSFGKTLSASATALMQFSLAIPYVLCFVIPAVTMGVWADEEKSGTYKLLLSYPVNEYEIVFSKFLSSSLFFCLLLATTLPIALISPAGTEVGTATGVDLVSSAARFISGGSGTVISTYLAIALFGFVAISIGEFFSFVTRLAVPSFLLSATSIFTLFFISARNRLYVASRGELDTRDIFFFIALIIAFNLLSVHAVTRRRKSP
jgi:ABC-2 type transport system permease protein